MSSDLVGVVLAGGRSSRLGQDKTRLELNGRTLAAATADRLGLVCGEVLLADNDRGLIEGLPSVPDARAAGPAGGILGAAAARPGRDLLVVACDLPNVTAGLLAAIASVNDGDWVVPRWSRGIEPLCALYRPSALMVLARLAESGIFAPHRMLDEPTVGVQFIDESVLAEFGSPEHLFLNINTPEQLTRLKTGL